MTTMEEIVAGHLSCIIETAQRDDVGFEKLLAWIKAEAESALAQLNAGDPEGEEQP